MTLIKTRTHFCQFPRINAWVLFFVVLAFPAGACAKVVFEDFYNDPGIGGWVCTDPVPPGYTSKASSPAPSTHNGVTRYAGEITPEGAIVGNSLKMWRRNGIWTGYAGYLNKELSSREFSEKYRALYFRWYIKIPPGWNWANSPGMKLNRWYFGKTAGSTAKQMTVNIQGGSISSRLQFYFPGTPEFMYYSDKTVPEMGLNDGKWHSLEIYVRLSTDSSTFDGELRLFVDGKEKYLGRPYQAPKKGLANIVYPVDRDDYFTSVFPPAIGNLGSGASWNFPTNAWYSIDFDSYVVSTQRVGHDYGYGESGTTEPSWSLGTDTSGKGAITRSPDKKSYPDGASVQLTANPEPGWAFSAWGGALSGNKNPETILMDANKTVTATFSETVAGDSDSVLAESFADNNFSSRGWFDGEWGDIAKGQGVDGGNCLRAHWRQGNTAPDQAASMRRDLGGNHEQLFVRYWVKYDKNWQGSGGSWHPHLFNIISNVDYEENPWKGMACAYMALYMESVTGQSLPYRITPRFAIQDCARVNTLYGSVPNNIAETTENRSATHCNGSVAGQDCGSFGTCYSMGGGHYYSATTWDGDIQIPKGEWVKEEYWFKMNSVENGIGIPDGELRMWVNDRLAISSDSVIYRTGEHPDMGLQMFMFGHYMEQGSPVDQTLLIDQLEIFDVNPKQDPVFGLNPPGGLKIIE